MKKYQELILNVGIGITERIVEIRDELSERIRLVGFNRKSSFLMSFEVCFDPLNGEKWETLGSGLYVLGDLEGTIRAYDRAIELGYENYGLYIYRGEILKRLGYEAEAEESFRQGDKIFRRGENGN